MFSMTSHWPTLKRNPRWPKKGFLDVTCCETHLLLEISRQNKQLNETVKLKLSCCCDCSYIWLRNNVSDYYHNSKCWVQKYTLQPFICLCISSLCPWLFSTVRCWGGGSRPFWLLWLWLTPSFSASSLVGVPEFSGERALRTCCCQPERCHRPLSYVWSPEWQLIIPPLPLWPTHSVAPSLSIVRVWLWTTTAIFHVLSEFQNQNSWLLSNKCAGCPCNEDAGMLGCNIRNITSL